MGVKITQLETGTYGDDKFIPIADTTNGTKKLPLSQIAENIGYEFTDDGNGNIVITEKGAGT